MSEQLTQMMERAARQAPPSGVTGAGALAAGRGRVRRRRAVGVGSAVAVVALVGIGWLGLRGDDVLGTPAVTPASVTWEVEQATTVTVVDDERAAVSRIVVTRGPEGAQATLTVGGEQEAVDGTRTGYGAEIFRGDSATLLLWRHPVAADGVVPVWQTSSYESGPSQGDDQLWYAVTTDRDAEPVDLVFHDEGTVWTASGEVADSLVVGDQRTRRRVFALPQADLAGVVDEERGVVLMAEGAKLVGTQQQTWWQGGEPYEWVLARLPQEATRARLISEAPGRHVAGDPVVDTQALRGSAWALISREPVGRGQESFFAPDVQWSADGQRWQDRDGDSLDLVGLAGLALSRDGDQVRAARAGVALEEISGLPDDMWGWEDQGGVVLVADVPDLEPTADLVPLVRFLGPMRGGGPPPVVPSSVSVVEAATLEVSGEELPAIRLAPSDQEELVGALVIDDTRGILQVLGGPPLTPDLGLGEDVGVAAAEGVPFWAAWRSVEVATVFEGPGLVAIERPGQEWDLLARLPQRGGDPVIVPADESMTVEPSLGEVTVAGGIRWWSFTMQAPGIEDLSERLSGLDTDGDGAVDLPLDLFMPES